MRDRLRNLELGFDHDVWSAVLWFAGVGGSILTVVTGSTTYGLPLALVVVMFARAHYRWRLKQVQPEEVHHEQATKSKSTRYCTSCGRKYIEWRRQEGFDGLTGEPHFVVTMACPQWDRQAAQRAYNEQMERAYKAGALFASMTYPTLDVNCSHITATAEQPQLHAGHAPGEVEATCEGCIEDMVANEIITREDAAKLRSKR